MSNPETNIKQCFWCGTFGNDKNHVSISEDVPPRWLSGEKKIKMSNCVPQCKECKNALALLDDSVVGYFKYGPGIDLEKVEGSNNFVNNKGLYARRINLNGNEDYAQANGCLLLWLRKLLVGLWYKEKGTYFDGGMFLLAHWLTFDDPEMYVSGVVTPTQVAINLLFDIDDEITGNDYQTEFYKKHPLIIPLFFLLGAKYHFHYNSYVFQFMVVLPATVCIYLSLILSALHLFQICMVNHHSI